jgi:hypothetical protein
MHSWRAYAGAYTGFVRALTEPVRLAALERPEGGIGIVERLYGHIRDRLLAQPDRCAFRPVRVADLSARR